MKSWIAGLDKAVKACCLKFVDFMRHSVAKEMMGYNQDLIFQIINEFSNGLDLTLGSSGGDTMRVKTNHAYP